MIESIERVTTAASITAPREVMALGGREVALRFDNRQIRETELAWQTYAGKPMGYLGILYQAEAGVFAALCALIYGGIRSAQEADGVPRRERMTIEALDAALDYRAAQEAREAIVGAAVGALPKAGAQKKAEG